MTPSPIVPLGLVLVVALAMRLAFFGGLLGEDDVMYLDAARGVAGGRYDEHPAYATRHGLILPLIVAVRLLGETERAMALVPLAYSLAGIALAYGIGVRLGGWRLGLGAALLLAVVPLDVVAATDLHRDLPLAVWLAATLWAVLRAERDERHCRRWMLAAGIAFGAAYVTKELALAFVLVLAVRVLWLRRPRDGYRWLALGFALVAGADTAWLGYWTGDPLYRYAPSVTAIYVTEAERLTRPSYSWMLDYPRMLVDPSHPGFGFFAGIFVLVAIGTVWGLRRRDVVVTEMTAWWVPLFVVLNFVPLDPSFTRPPFPHFPRYLHPLLIAFSLVAARALGEAMRPRLRAIAVTAFAVLALAGTWTAHVDYRVWAAPARAAARELERLPASVRVATDETSAWLLRRLLPARRDGIVGFASPLAATADTLVLRDPVFLATETRLGRPVPPAVFAPPPTWTRVAELARPARPSMRRAIMAWLGRREPPARGVAGAELWRVPHARAIRTGP